MFKICFLIRCFFDNLVEAEKLFDLPSEDYTKFVELKTEFDGVKQVYQLFKRQNLARENWGQTLWTNLNPNTLADGIDGFINEFRKLSKWVTAP